MRKYGSQLLKIKFLISNSIRFIDFINSTGEHQYKNFMIMCHVAAALVNQGPKFQSLRFYRLYRHQIFQILRLQFQNPIWKFHDHVSCCCCSLWPVWGFFVQKLFALYCIIGFFYHQNQRPSRDHRVAPAMYYRLISE